MIEPKPIELNVDIEHEIRSVLLKTYSQAESYVDMLLDTEPLVERFQYLYSVIGPELFAPTTRILCSGFSVGSEMIMARQFGFGAIHGVEVDGFLVETCKKRLSYFSEMYPVYYDGNYLPYSDSRYDVITSGHVIEHTRSPELYLSECMRVLREGGYISLEFPNRYNFTELHTGLLSFEWLPRFIRNALIRLVSCKISPLSKEVKSKYASIVGTNLQQISIGYIKRALKQTGYSFQILNVSTPAPGYVRCVIRKSSLPFSLTNH